jgi:hypothetical protein
MTGFWCHTGGTEGSGTGHWTLWSVKWMGWTGQEGALEAELAYMRKQSRSLDSVVCGVDGLDSGQWKDCKLNLERDGLQSCLDPKSQYY